MNSSSINLHENFDQNLQNNCENYFTRCESKPIASTTEEEHLQQNMDYNGQQYLTPNYLVVEYPQATPDTYFSSSLYNENHQKGRTQKTGVVQTPTFVLQANLQ